MRITVTHNAAVVADVYVDGSESTNATRAAAQGNLDALATVSEPWGDRPEQGRPVVRHRDGTPSMPAHHQHVQISIDDIDDLRRAIDDFGLAVEALGESS